MQLIAVRGGGFFQAFPEKRLWTASEVQEHVASKTAANDAKAVYNELDALIRAGRLKRISRGRTSAPALLAGLPVLEVTTTGRRSGQRRTSHLIAIPVGDCLALLGTNFGQARTPAWVLNLEPDPRATVSYRARSLEVVARAAAADEADEVMRRADGLYPGYRRYRERITGRRVRIFVLDAVVTPTPAAPTSG